MPDLSTYCYNVDAPLQGVAAVGWLDHEHPFPQGQMPQEALERLRCLCERHAIRKLYGYHHCPFCEAYPAQDGGLALGSREVWVPAADGFRFLAAPDLILHYCKAHEYLPPKPFIDALMNLDISTVSKETIAQGIKACSEELYRHVEFEIAAAISPEEALRVALKAPRDGVSSPAVSRPVQAGQTKSRWWKRIFVGVACIGVAFLVLMGVGTCRAYHIFITEDRISDAFTPVVRALDEYKEENKVPPQRLEQLVPKFIPELPSSPLVDSTGYRIMPDGTTWELALHSRALSTPRVYIYRSTMSFSEAEWARTINSFHGWCVFRE